MSNSRNLCNATFANRIQTSKLQTMVESTAAKNAEMDIEEISYSILDILHNERNFEKKMEKFLLRDPSTIFTVCQFFQQKGYTIRYPKDCTYVVISW